MTKSNIADGKTLKRMFALGTVWLEKAAPDINAINVFPVPDGDTGINMVLTMRSAMEEAGENPDGHASSVAKSMASGALMGARGNSGVILSQFCRGLAKGLEGKASFGGRDFANALSEASQAAYDGLVHPVEGTILTVLKDAAAAATTYAGSDSDSLASVMEIATQAARESVTRTPDLLPVLREAGVVDAGGQGLYVLFDGALHYLRGKSSEIKHQKPDLVATSEPLTPHLTQIATEAEVPYGYCTNFVLEGKKLDAEEIRNKLKRKGQSVIVTGADSLVRVHIHTFKPGEILEYSTRLGTLHQIDIQNMDDQYEEFIKIQRGKMPKVDVAVVAVASGEGIFQVFNSLGSTLIVPGGQTMNPSVRQLLHAVESAPADSVIVLPNNKNIIATAHQIQSLSPKQVKVVPSRTIPQGIAALLAFNYDLNVADNAQVMDEALGTVKTLEITRAVRRTQVNGLRIRRGQFIAILNDEEIIATDNDILVVIFEALIKTEVQQAEMVTIYYGAEIQAAEAEGVAQEIRSRYKAQVEVVHGGQLHYDFIISLE